MLLGKKLMHQNYSTSFPVLLYAFGGTVIPIIYFYIVKSTPIIQTTKTLVINLTVSHRTPITIFGVFKIYGKLHNLAGLQFSKILPEMRGLP
jgi:hypothetical protein